MHKIINYVYTAIYRLPRTTSWQNTWSYCVKSGQFCFGRWWLQLFFMLCSELGQPRDAGDIVGKQNKGSGDWECGWLWYAVLWYANTTLRVNVNLMHMQLTFVRQTSIKLLENNINFNLHKSYARDRYFLTVQVQIARCLTKISKSWMQSNNSKFGNYKATSLKCHYTRCIIKWNHRHLEKENCAHLQLEHICIQEIVF